MATAAWVWLIEELQGQIEEMKNEIQRLKWQVEDLERREMECQ